MGMNKIPVRQTIARGYSFAIKDFPRILGVIWFPFAITILGSLALAGQTNAITTAFATRNFAAIAHMAWIFLPVYAVAIVLLAMQIAGITELALGKRTGSPFFYFTLGRPVWRLIGSYLLVFLLLIAAIVVVIASFGLFAAILAGVTGVAKGSKPSGAAAAVLGLSAILAVIVCYCAFIYGLVRQTFLLTPVVIAEEKIGLRRAWGLGRGNFWRMFVIVLAMLIPLFIVEGIFLFGFVWHGFPPVPQPGATPEQIEALNAQNAANIIRLMKYWYVTYPVFLVVSIVFYGYFCGAQSFAYRFLVPEETAEGSR